MRRSFASRRPRYWSVKRSASDRIATKKPTNNVCPTRRLLLRYSTRYYEFLPGGPDVIVPDKEIDPRWQDIEHGRDPVLDWVLRY